MTRTSIKTHTGAFYVLIIGDHFGSARPRQIHLRVLISARPQDDVTTDDDSLEGEEKKRVPTSVRFFWPCAPLSYAQRRANGALGRRHTTSSTLHTSFFSKSSPHGIRDTDADGDGDQDPVRQFSSLPACGATEV